MKSKGIDEQREEVRSWKRLC